MRKEEGQIDIEDGSDEYIATVNKSYRATNLSINLTQTISEQANEIEPDKVGSNLNYYNNKNQIMTEYVVHFYIKYFLANNFKEIDYYKNLLKKKLNEIKPVSEVYVTDIQDNQVGFGIQMQTDNDAIYILDNIKMRYFLTFYDKKGQFPYIEKSKAFDLYMKYGREKDKNSEYQKESTKTLELGELGSNRKRSNSKTRKIVERKDNKDLKEIKDNRDIRSRLEKDGTSDKNLKDKEKERFVYDKNYLLFQNIYYFGTQMIVEI